MNTKTLKIPEKIHKELKVYIASTDENMTDFAGLAIMEKLKLEHLPVDVSNVEDQRS